MSKKKPIKIVHAKIGRSKAVGMAFTEDRHIILDIRLKGFDYLETAIHEIIHCQNPKWNEITVLARAKEMAELLWNLGFRQVDNHK
jgi:hypothetical protein